MEKNVKKRRQRCFRHKASERSWNEYVFGFIDYRGVHIWRCRECKEKDDEWLARYEKRIEKERIDRDERWKKLWTKQKEKEDARRISKKEDLWDSEIRNILSIGTKLKGTQRYEYQQSMPKELLQLARATIKLQRFIKEKKDLIGVPKTKTIPKNIFLEKCKKHGELKIVDCVKSGKRPDGTQKYKCRKCQRDMQHSHYRSNREKILRNHSEYRRRKRVNHKEH